MESLEEILERARVKFGSETWRDYMKYLFNDDLRIYEVKNTKKEKMPDKIQQNANSEKSINREDINHVQLKMF